MMQAKRYLIPMLLLAALLLGGCARGERVRNDAAQPAGQESASAVVTQAAEPQDSELDDLDQLLGELEKELKQTDTAVEIP
jgi:hypothetical protein